MQRMSLPTRLLVYALLLSGAVVFAFPFFWMISTSVKMDRELVRRPGEGLNLLPEAPHPVPRGPYLDRWMTADLVGPFQDELLPALETMVTRSGFRAPPAVDQAAAVRHTARSLYQRLRRVLPEAIWTGEPLRDEPDAAPLDQRQSLDRLIDAAERRVTPELIADAFMRIYREFRLGQVRLRSFQFEEFAIDPDRPISQRLTNRTPDTATLVDHQPPGELPYAVVHYDFTRAAGDAATTDDADHAPDQFVLTRTVSLPFAAEQLKRIQLDIQPDDSWHELWCTLELPGRRYVAERPVLLADFTPLSVYWQVPSEDDRSTKIRSWTVLQPAEPAANAPPLAPDRARITFTVRRVGEAQAHWHKLAFNFHRVARQIPFWRYVRVSTFLVVANIVLTLLASSFIAFAFARLTWPGRDFCFILMLATLMIPPQVTMIPHFLIWRDLGAYNTLAPLWVPAVFGNAFFIFLLRQFMKGIPRDLEDAARIDGCGFLRIYWHVILPLIKPSLAAIAIFTFMGVWNEFLAPLIYIADQRLYPLAFGLYAFTVQVESQPALTMAAALLMTLPVIAIFFAAQRYFIQGVTLTGLKG